MPKTYSLALGIALLVSAGFGCDETVEADAGGRTDSGGTDGGGDTDSGTDADGGGDSAADSGGGAVALCDQQHLILEEIAIQDTPRMITITLFNPTDAPIVIDGSAYTLCQRANYRGVETIEAGVTVAPNGRHTFMLPSIFNARGNDRGEFALYDPASFANPVAQKDFVCWGDLTGLESRLFVAVMDEGWVGPCLPMLTGALRRIQDSDGTSAASYDPTGATAPLACP